MHRNRLLVFEEVGRPALVRLTTAEKHHQLCQVSASWLPLPMLPSRQRPRVHPEAPSHGLLAQSEVPSNPGQGLPRCPTRVVGAVTEEFDDLWPVGEGRSGLSALPKVNATLRRSDSLPHLLLEESQLKPPFPEVVRDRP